MGQEEIIKILEDSNKWMSFKDLSKRLQTSKGSIYRALRKLKKRDYVQVKTEIIFNEKQNNITYYRIKNVK